ncbi:MAG: hypothetical protein R3233_09840 [Xanthomonadales bacterium]|nr:hypothetical protein [Xanthomonadales bacterium]
MNHNSGIKCAIRRGLAAAGLVALAFTSTADPISALQANDGNSGVFASTTGGGHYLIGGSIDVEFAFAAKQKNNGTANGHFRQSLIFQGELVEFEGEVICVTVDSDNHRAWIGGVVTVNNSVHPSFTTAIHEPGKDVWFRVLDSGEGNNAEADRSTFLGFEGAAGIITSEEYCEAMIWPDNNDRTSPVIEGNIQVRP